MALRTIKGFEAKNENFTGVSALVKPTRQMIISAPQTLALHGSTLVG